MCFTFIRGMILQAKAIICLFSVKNKNRFRGLILPSVWNIDHPFSITTTLRICQGLSTDQLNWKSNHNVFQFVSCWSHSCRVFLNIFNDYACFLFSNPIARLVFLRVMLPYFCYYRYYMYCNEYQLSFPNSVFY